MLTTPYPRDGPTVRSAWVTESAWEEEVHELKVPWLAVSISRTQGLKDPSSALPPFLPADQPNSTQYVAVNTLLSLRDPSIKLSIHPRHYNCGCPPCEDHPRFSVTAHVGTNARSLGSVPPVAITRRSDPYCFGGLSKVRQRQVEYRLTRTRRARISSSYQRRFHPP